MNVSLALNAGKLPTVQLFWINDTIEGTGIVMQLKVSIPSLIRGDKFLRLSLPGRVPLHSLFDFALPHLKASLRLAI